VRVGETWLPRLLAAGGPKPAAAPPRGASGARRGGEGGGGGGAESSGGAAAGGGPDQADLALLKLFEFLTASLCLYVIDEKPPTKAPAGVWVDDGGAGGVKDG
jgi:hypothetical protein